MKPRDPQLSLGLGMALPLNDGHWCDGAGINYLGGRLQLQLSTSHRQATLEGEALHLPLPPEASARQIRDAAEAWLRREAQQLIGERIHHHAARIGLTPPRLLLSFATRSGWVVAEEGCLRCNWHLVEQPAEVIDQVIGRAVAHLPRPQQEGDLFAALV